MYDKGMRTESMNVVKGVIETDFSNGFTFLFKLQFAKIADSSPYFKALADFGAVTVFAPTNDAIQAYQPSQGKFDNYTLRYHLCKQEKIASL